VLKKVWTDHLERGGDEGREGGCLRKCGQTIWNGEETKGGRGVA